MNKLLTALIFLSTSVCAQNAFKAGFIKHLDGNIEYGYIQVTPPLVPVEICYFKPNLDDLVQEIQPSQISSFAFLPGATYQAILTKSLNEKPDVFAIEIYKGKTTVFKSGNRYLILKGEQLQEVTEEDYKWIISRIFNDCPYIQERVKTSKFSELELIYLTKSYDRCSSRKRPSDYHGNNLEFAVSVYAGYDQSNTGFTDISGLSSLGGHSATNAKPYRFGAQVQVTYPALSPNLSLISGIICKPQQYTVAYTGAGSVAAYSFSYNSTDVQIPIGLQIQPIRKERISVFIHAGTMVILPGQFSSHQLLDTRTPSGIYQDESIPVTGITGTSAIFAGVGTMIRMNRHFRAFLNLQYQNGTGRLIDQTITRARLQSSGISFVVGLTF